MDEDNQEQAAERAELHFLAAMLDEVMRTLLRKGTLTRGELNEVEQRVSIRTGTAPRIW
jgi:hypothetical protein